MKKLLLTGIAALFLATGTAHAVEIPKQYRGVAADQRIPPRAFVFLPRAEIST
jgi:hypothetical protein